MVCLKIENSILSVLSEKRKLYALWILGVFMIGLVSAAPGAGIGNLNQPLKDICSAFKSLVPILAFMMLFLAGALYAAGQVMGAETRARANVWSTAMLTGALIGVLIALIGPELIKAFYTAFPSAGTATSC